MNHSNFDFLIAGLPDRVRYLEARGLFSDARRLIERILAENAELPDIMRHRLEWELERIERIKKDYTLSQRDALESLSGRIPDLTPSDFTKWMEEGFIDHREIEGEMRIFNDFLSNLLRDASEAKKRSKQDRTSQELMDLVHRHIDFVTEKSEISGSRYTEPVKNRVLMRLRVKSGAVPEGEIVRVWMPFPQKGPLQQEIRLISKEPRDYILAPEGCSQRTIYFERESVKGEELVFQVEYQYVAQAWYQEIDPGKVVPYIKDELLERDVSEQLPHIAFTPYLRKLAKEITSTESNPYIKAWRVYKWITENIRYALVPEYSTIECISDYAARNMRGDCGVQALLFITLCRIAGVPARWQSGWFLNPIKSSPHDWAQFYVEPYGWLYADPSFGGRRKSIEKYHRFYFGNMDHFRLVANTDISSELIPAKKHFRSDIVDNQRGEVEWRETNLYYDKWDYELTVVSHGMSEDIHTVS